MQFLKTDDNANVFPTPLRVKRQYIKKKKPITQPPLPPKNTKRGRPLNSSKNIVEQPMPLVTSRTIPPTPSTIDSLQYTNSPKVYKSVRVET